MTDELYEEIHPVVNCTQLMTSSPDFLLYNADARTRRELFILDMQRSACEPTFVERTGEACFLMLVNSVLPTDKNH